MKKIKILTVIILAFLGSLNLYSQDWIYSNIVKGVTKNTSPNGMGIDADSNIYVLGTFQADIDFGSNGNAELTSAVRVAFLAKYNINGDTLWVHRIGDAAKVRGKGIAVDNNANIYIVGSLEGESEFESKVTGPVTLDNRIAGDEEIFLAKYDSSGSLQWADTVAAGTGDDRPDAIYVDSEGSIIITGYYNTELFFHTSPTTGTTITSTGVDNFVAKFDNDGDFLWVTKIDGDDNTTKINRISACLDEGYFITGEYYGNLFIGESYELANSGLSDIVLFKINKSGTVQWTRKGGGTGYDGAFSNYSDDLGFVYITGDVQNDVIFDSTATLSSQQLSADGEDVFVAKYNSDGKLYWISISEGASTERALNITGINDQLYLTGYYTGTNVVWGNDTISSGGLEDIFIASYDTSGVFAGVVSVGGDAEDYGQQIAVDVSGYPYMSGYYVSSTLDIGDSSYTNAGSKDLILAKSCPFIGIYPDTTGISCNSLNDGSITLSIVGYDGPFTYSWSGPNAFSSTNQNISSLEKGIYVVTVTYASGCTKVGYAEITEPSVISIGSEVKTDILGCPRDSTGDITISGVSGGTIPYTYSIDGGSTFEDNSGVFTNLPAGEYDIVVKDNNNCEKPGSTLEITQSDTISIDSIKVTPTGCGEDNTGKIVIHATRGVELFDYSINGGGGFEDDSLFTGLAAGDYQIVVKDASTCLEYGDTVTVDHRADCGGQNLFSQAWSNIVKGVTKNTSPNGMGIDADSNIYVLGTFQADIDFGSNGNAELTSAVRVAFLAKYNINGDTLWVHRIGDAAKVRGKGIAVDNNANIYIVGSLEGESEFESKVTGPVTLDNRIAGDEEIFLAKYDSSGSLQWADTVAAGTGDDRPDAIYVDSEGSIIITGYYNTELFFHTSPTTGTTITSTGVDNFVAKFDNDGDFLWVTKIDGDDNTTKINRISACLDEGYFITGEYYGNLFIGESYELANSGLSDIVLFKINKSGTVQWTRKGGGTGYDGAFSNYSDDLGFVYITGDVQNDVIFDSTATLSSQQLSADGEDVFVAKYNSDGKLYWISISEGASTERALNITGINDQLYLTGYYTGTNVVWGNDTISSGGLEDIFIASYDTSGVFAGVVSVGGDAEDYGQQIAVDVSGYPYMSGYYVSSTLDIGDSSYTNAGSKDLILAKSCPFIGIYPDTTGISCNSLNDGSITLSIVGYDGPFTYSWSGPNAFSSTDQNISSLEKGIYVVTVTYASGCTKVGYAEITEPSVISIGSEVKTDILGCPRDSTGDITISGVSGGTIPYTYSIDGGSTFEDNSGVFTNLPAGEYDIVVKDNNNCEKPGSTLEITQSDTISIDSIKVTPTDCGVDNSGKIVIHATRGAELFDYSINGGDGFQDDSLFTGLAAGDYQIVVKDASACLEYGDTVTVDLRADFGIDTIYAVDISCNGLNDGKLTFVPVGGVTPILYSYDGGNTYLPDSIFTSLPAGDYEIAIIDDDGCEVLGDTITFTDPSVVSITDESKTDVLCNGESTGTITITASGGTGTLLYSSNGGTDYFDNGGSFTDLASGDYDIMVKDSNDCGLAGSTISIFDPPALAINTQIPTNITCFGLSDGTITISASGGTGTLQYSKDAGDNYQVDSVFTGLPAADDYNVKVKDANECVVSGGTMVVSEPEAVGIDTVITTLISCNGLSDAKIDITATGGTGSLEYSIDEGVTYQSDSTFSSLSPGAYEIVIKDANGCDEEGDTINFSDPAVLSITGYDSTNILDCYGDSTGIITITATGGTGTIVYSVDGGTNYSATSTITLLTAGSFETAVKDDNECILLGDTIILSEPVMISISGELITSVTGCSGDTTGAITITASGGTGTLSYSIDGGLLYKDNDGSFNNLGAGDYSVEVKDGNDCEVEGSDLTVSEPNSVKINSESVTDITGWNLNDGLITIIATGGTGSISYSIDSGIVYQASGIFSGLSAGDYDVLVKDENECKLSGSELTVNDPYSGIETINENRLQIPSVLTPNSDGENDLWVIKNINKYPECLVRVFDQQGRIIFSSEGYNEPWDGTKNGRILPPSIYFYIIDTGNGDIPYKGSVLIMK